MVNLPSDAFAVFDRAKQQATSQCINEDQQKHPHYNEKTFVDRHDDRQHQHLKSSVFARDGEEAQDNDHKAKRVR